MVFKLVFIHVLGFDLLVWGIRAMLSQLGGDLLQLAFVGFQLFLLQEITQAFSVQKIIREKHRTSVRSFLRNDFSLSKESNEEPLVLSPSNFFLGQC